MGQVGQHAGGLKEMHSRKTTAPFCSSHWGKMGTPWFYGYVWQAEDEEACGRLLVPSTHTSSSGNPHLPPFVLLLLVRTQELQGPPFELGRVLMCVEGGTLPWSQLLPCQHLHSQV